MDDELEEEQPEIYVEPQPPVEPLQEHVNKMLPRAGEPEDSPDEDEGQEADKEEIISQNPMNGSAEEAHLIDKAGVEVYLKSSIFDASELLNMALEAREAVIKMRMGNGKSVLGVG